MADSGDFIKVPECFFDKCTFCTSVGFGGNRPIDKYRATSFAQVCSSHINQDRLSVIGIAEVITAGRPNGSKVEDNHPAIAPGIQNDWVS